MEFELDPLATAQPTAPSPDPSVAPLGTPVALTTGGTTPSVPTFMPPKPTMGGIIQMTEKDFVPWTGGRPLVDWTGLDPTSRTTPKSPNQQRPVSSSAAQKGHIYRQTGITTKKLSRADLDLPHFEEKVWRHFCDTGLDTIAYVPNPIGSTEMINVIQEHDRFSVESVIKLVQAQVKKYDDYDIQSDDEATEFLKESFGELEYESNPPNMTNVEEVEYMDVDGTNLKSYVAMPSDEWQRPLPAVLIIPDWDGNNEYEQERATLLAEMGYGT